MNCDGYRKLVASVENDEKKSPGFHDYRAKLDWVIKRVEHYAESTGLPPEAILDAWESKRDYWYMNYYQDACQPVISPGKVRVFDSTGDLLASIGQPQFRCPSCGGISTSPYKCTTGLKVGKQICDWKSYGLFGHLGKGISVFVKDKMAIEAIFMPIAWETLKP